MVFADLADGKARVVVASQPLSRVLVEKALHSAQEDADSAPSVHCHAHRLAARATSAAPAGQAQVQSFQEVLAAAEAEL
ncbi:hypothetical protein Tsubulata_013240, partial [Turnera subulata]